MLNVLVLGQGAREHAICWRLQCSSRVSKVLCYPGNDGIASVAEIVKTNKNIPAIIAENKIDLLVPGSDSYLADGIVDLCSNLCLTVGPNRSAAKLESSKYFTKQIAEQYNIPTAQYKFFKDIKSAQQWIQDLNQYPIVIKQDGLAAGKGVKIANSFEDASNALKLNQGPWVVEEFIKGKEFSAFYYVHKNNPKFIATAADYKKLHEGDKGPNTGGMGAYSGNDICSKADIDYTTERIVNPAMNALLDMNITYNGILYAGLIKNKNGISLLEFNVRFGDPEAQVILPRMKSDIVTMFCDGYFKFDDSHSLCVSLCAKEYPFRAPISKKISINQDIPEDINLFYAGVRSENNQMYVNGGRVISVSATRSTYEQALKDVYKAVDMISWDGIYYRKDINRRTV